MLCLRLLAVAGTSLLLAAMAGCGGGSGSASTTASTAAPPTKAVDALAPVAPVADFPRASRLDYRKARAKYGDSLAFAPGISVLRHGTTRVPFLVLDAGANPVSGAAVAVYTMRNDGSGVHGPYPAREQPFGIGPAYLSRTTSSDPNQQKQFYVADVKTSGVRRRCSRSHGSAARR